MDELILYDDLDEFQEQQDKKSKELLDVEEKYELSLKNIGNLEIENINLTKKIQRIELSFQSLLDTARAELKRKDKEIERLRKEKDDICFRRRIPRQWINETESVQFGEKSAQQPQFVRNPFRCDKTSETVTVVSTSAISEKDNTKFIDPGDKTLRSEDSEKRFIESHHKRNRSRDDDRQHHSKKHKIDVDEKFQKTSKPCKSEIKIDGDTRNKIRLKENENYQKEPFRSRDIGSNRLINDHSANRKNRDMNSLKASNSTERNRNRFDRARSRDGNRRTCDRSRERKKSSESPERIRKHRDKGRSRDRKSSDLHRYHHKGLRRHKKRDRKNNDKNHIKSSRSPERNSHKHSKDRDHHNRPNILTDYTNKKTGKSQSALDNVCQELGFKDVTKLSENFQTNENNSDKKEISRASFDELQSSNENKNLNLKSKDDNNEKSKNKELLSKEAFEVLADNDKESLSELELTKSSKHQVLKVTKSKLGATYKNDLTDKTTKVTSSCSDTIDSISAKDSQELTKTNEFEDIEGEQLQKYKDGDDDLKTQMSNKQNSIASRKLSTPRKIALFDSLFGPSPISNSSSTSCSSSKSLLTNIMDILASSTNSQDAITATPSPGDNTNDNSCVQTAPKNKEKTYDAKEFDKCFTKTDDSSKNDKNIISVIDLTDDHVSIDVSDIEFVQIPGLDFHTKSYTTIETTLNDSLNEKFNFLMADKCKADKSTLKLLENECQKDISIEEILPQSEDSYKLPTNVFEKQLNHNDYLSKPGLDLLPIAKKTSSILSATINKNFESIPANIFNAIEISETDLGKNNASEIPPLLPDVPQGDTDKSTKIPTSAVEETTTGTSSVLELIESESASSEGADNNGESISGLELTQEILKVSVNESETLDKDLQAIESTKEILTETEEERSETLRYQSDINNVEITQISIANKILKVNQNNKAQKSIQISETVSNTINKNLNKNIEDLQDSSSASITTEKLKEDMDLNLDSRTTEQNGDEINETVSSTTNKNANKNIEVRQVSLPDSIRTEKLTILDVGDQNTDSNTKEKAADEITGTINTNLDSTQTKSSKFMKSNDLETSSEAKRMEYELDVIEGIENKSIRINKNVEQDTTIGTTLVLETVEIEDSSDSVVIESDIQVVDNNGESIPALELNLSSTKKILKESDNEKEIPEKDLQSIESSKEIVTEIEEETSKTLRLVQCKINNDHTSQISIADEISEVNQNNEARESVQTCETVSNTINKRFNKNIEYLQDSISTKNLEDLQVSSPDSISTEKLEVDIDLNLDSHATENNDDEVIETVSNTTNQTANKNIEDPQVSLPDSTRTEKLTIQEVGGQNIEEKTADEITGMINTNIDFMQIKNSNVIEISEIDIASTSLSLMKSNVLETSSAAKRIEYDLNIIEGIEDKSMRINKNVEQDTTTGTTLVLESVEIEDSSDSVVIESDMQVVGNNGESIPELELNLSSTKKILKECDNEKEIPEKDLQSIETSKEIVTEIEEETLKTLRLVEYKINNDHTSQISISDEISEVNQNNEARESIQTCETASNTINKRFNKYIEYLQDSISTQNLEYLQVSSPDSIATEKLEVDMDLNLESHTAENNGNELIETVSNNKNIEDPQVSLPHSIRTEKLTIQDVGGQNTEEKMADEITGTIITNLDFMQIKSSNVIEISETGNASTIRINKNVEQDTNSGTTLVLESVEVEDSSHSAVIESDIQVSIASEMKINQNNEAQETVTQITNNIDDKKIEDLQVSLANSIPTEKLTVQDVKELNLESHITQETDDEIPETVSDTTNKTTNRNVGIMKDSLPDSLSSIAKLKDVGNENTIENSKNNFESILPENESFNEMNVKNKAELTSLNIIEEKIYECHGGKSKADNDNNVISPKNSTDVIDEDDIENKDINVIKTLAFKDNKSAINVNKTEAEIPKRNGEETKTDDKNNILIEYHSAYVLEENQIGNNDKNIISVESENQVDYLPDHYIPDLDLVSSSTQKTTTMFEGEQEILENHAIDENVDKFSNTLENVECFILSENNSSREAAVTTENVEIISENLKTNFTNTETHNELVQTKAHLIPGIDSFTTRKKESFRKLENKQQTVVIEEYSELPATCFKITENLTELNLSEKECSKDTGIIDEVAMAKLVGFENKLKNKEKNSEVDPLDSSDLILTPTEETTYVIESECQIVETHTMDAISLESDLKQKKSDILNVVVSIDNSKKYLIQAASTPCLDFTSTQESNADIHTTGEIKANYSKLSDYVLVSNLMDKVLNNDEIDIVDKDGLATSLHIQPDKFVDESPINSNDSIAIPTTQTETNDIENGEKFLEILAPDANATKKYNTSVRSSISALTAKESIKETLNLDKVVMSTTKDLESSNKSSNIETKKTAVDHQKHLFASKNNNTSENSPDSDLNRNGPTKETHIFDEDSMSTKNKLEHSDQSANSECKKQADHGKHNVVPIHNLESCESLELLIVNQIDQQTPAKASPYKELTEQGTLNEIYSGEENCIRNDLEISNKIANLASALNIKTIPTEEATKGNKNKHILETHSLIKTNIGKCKSDNAKQLIANSSKDINNLDKSVLEIPTDFIPCSGLTHDNDELENSLLEYVKINKPFANTNKSSEDTPSPHRSEKRSRKASHDEEENTFAICTKIGCSKDQSKIVSSHFSLDLESVPSQKPDKEIHHSEEVREIDDHTSLTVFPTVTNNVNLSGSKGNTILTSIIDDICLPKEASNGEPKKIGFPSDILPSIDSILTSNIKDDLVREQQTISDTNESSKAENKEFDNDLKTTSRENKISNIDLTRNIQPKKQTIHQELEQASSKVSKNITSKQKTDNENDDHIISSIAINNDEIYRDEDKRTEKTILRPTDVEHQNSGLENFASLIDVENRNSEMNAQLNIKQRNIEFVALESLDDIANKTTSKVNDELNSNSNEGTEIDSKRETQDLRSNLGTLKDFNVLNKDQTSLNELTNKSEDILKISSSKESEIIVIADKGKIDSIKSSEIKSTKGLLSLKDSMNSESQQNLQIIVNKNTPENATQNQDKAENMQLVMNVKALPKEIKINVIAGELLNLENEEHKIVTNKDFKETERSKIAIPQQKELQPYNKSPTAIQDSYNVPTILPSISTDSPTPPNFSGIFSKKSLQFAGDDDFVNQKHKRKLLHFSTTKPREYVLLAASVLCNVDNLENATKTNKKLHWELLENKNELTEIEDDTDIDNTDEERNKAREADINIEEPPPRLTPYKCLESLTSDSETQSEDESRYRSLPFLNSCSNKRKPLDQRRRTIDTVSITHAVSYYKHLEELEQKKKYESTLKKKEVKKQLNFLTNKCKKNKQCIEEISNVKAKIKVATKHTKETPQVVRELKKRGRPKTKCDNGREAINNLEIQKPNEIEVGINEEIQDDCVKKQKEKEQLLEKKPQNKGNNNIDINLENLLQSESNKLSNMNEKNQKDNEEEHVDQQTMSKDQQQVISNINNSLDDHRIYEEFLSSCSKPIKERKNTVIADHEETSSDNSEIAFSQENIGNKNKFQRRCSTSKLENEADNCLRLIETSKNDSKLNKESQKNSSEHLSGHEKHSENKRHRSREQVVEHIVKEALMLNDNLSSTEIKKHLSHKESVFDEDIKSGTNVVACDVIAPEIEFTTSQAVTFDKEQHIVTQDPLKQIKTSAILIGNRIMEKSSHTSIIYDKENSTNDRNISVAKNTEPECNKYFPEDDVPSTSSNETKSSEKNILQREVLNIKDQKLSVLDNHCLQNDKTFKQLKVRRDSVKEPIIYEKDIQQHNDEGKSKATQNENQPKKPIILKKNNSKVMKTQVKIVNTNAEVTNNKKKMISLEEIGIKVLPFKGHLSSFRIPKLNKESEVTKDKSWKLESYSEVINKTQHSNISNEIDKHCDKEKCALSLKKTEGKSLHQYEEKKPERKSHKDLALKQKREESKLSDKNKITANKTKDNVVCFEDKKIDEEMVHQHKEKIAKKTKENTKIFESALKETSQHIRYMEDTPQNSQDKTQKEISLHNNADGPHCSKGDVSENNNFIKEPLKICKNSKNIPAISKDINLFKLNETKEVESQENKEAATSKNKIKSITHKRKLFGPDMYIFEENYDNDAERSSESKNDNFEINNKQKVNEKLQEIVQEQNNKNSNTGSIKCNRAKSDSEDDSCQISSSLRSRRKSINLLRRILDSSSDEESKKNYLKSADSSQVTNQDSKTSTLRTLKSLKARRKFVNLQRRIYDSSCDEDSEENIKEHKEQDNSSELQAAASTNMNQKQILKEDISSEGSNHPAIPIKSLKIHKKTITKELNLKKYGNANDNEVKNLDSQHTVNTNQLEIVTCNKDGVATNRPTVTALRIRRKSMHEERGCLNIQQEEREIDNNLQLKTRRNVIKCDEDIENTKQSQKPSKIRRKSMYQESHTSNAQLDNKQQLETESSIDKKQLEVINSNKEKNSKTTPSLKRRKSMFQESVTVNIEEGNTKRHYQGPVVQSSRDDSQVELTICNEVEDTKPPPKKSMKMRRKSMYQESCTFHNHQEREKYNKYEDMESKSTSNKEKEVIKMRRKSMHQERTIQYDEKKKEQQNQNFIINTGNPKTPLLHDHQKEKLETEQDTQLLQLDNKPINLRLDTKLYAHTQHKTESNVNTVANNNKEADSNKNSVETNINQYCTLESSSQDDQPLNQTQIVIQNVEPTPLSYTKTKPRKRRVVKVLSTSREESPSYLKNLQIQHNTTQIQITPPLISPTLSHPIFTTDVTQQQSEISHILPPTPNKQYDDKFKEIDSKLHEIFQSPQYMVDYKTTTHPLDDSNVSSTALTLNESKPDITIEETIACNQKNDQSSINTSNDASAHNHSEIKHLMLGSSEYRFEKISDNVVNLFISRKRKRKRTN